MRQLQAKNDQINIDKQNDRAFAMMENQRSREENEKELFERNKQKEQMIDLKLALEE